MDAELSVDNRPPQDADLPSIWGGIAMITCGALLMLLPIVPLCIGMSGKEIDIIERSGDLLLGSPVIGLAFSFCGGVLFLLTGVGEVQKYPLRNRARATCISTTIISISFALTVGLIIFLKSAHYKSGRKALMEPSEGQALEEVLERTDRQIATLEKMQDEAAGPDQKTDKVLKALYKQRREVIGQLFPSAH